MKLELRGVAKMTLTLANYGEAGLRATGAALYQEGERILAASKAEVPVFFGILRASGRTGQPFYGRTAVEVVLGYGGAASKYAFFVHEGTAPHWPPIEPLRRWAELVLGDADLGYVVARKISEVGTAPTKYLERPFLAAQRGMAGRLAGAIALRLETFRARG